MKLPISKNMRIRPQFENVGEHTEEMLFFKKFALLSLTSLSIDDGNMKFDILLILCCSLGLTIAQKPTWQLRFSFNFMRATPTSLTLLL